MKYMDYILETLERIVNTPSPSGCTKEVMEIIRGEAEHFGFQTEFNRKRRPDYHSSGAGGECVRIFCPCGYAGAMVRSVRANGNSCPDSGRRHDDGGH